MRRLDVNSQKTRQGSRRGSARCRAGKDPPACSPVERIDRPWCRSSGTWSTCRGSHRGACPVQGTGHSVMVRTLGTLDARATGRRVAVPIRSKPRRRLPVRWNGSTVAGRGSAARWNGSTGPAAVSIVGGLGSTGRGWHRGGLPGARHWTSRDGANVGDARCQGYGSTCCRTDGSKPRRRLAARWNRSTGRGVDRRDLVDGPWLASRGLRCPVTFHGG